MSEGAKKLAQQIADNTMNVIGGYDHTTDTYTLIDAAVAPLVTALTEAAFILKGEDYNVADFEKALEQWRTGR